MAAALDAFLDILSATLGAASGALITAMANRQKNQDLRDKIVISQQELEKIRLENDRLLKVIEDREKQILAQEKEILEIKSAQKPKRKTRK